MTSIKDAAVDVERHEQRVRSVQAVFLSPPRGARALLSPPLNDWQAYTLASMAVLAVEQSDLEASL